MQRTKPPFRADHVGSLLRSSALKEARAKRDKGAITAAQLLQRFVGKTPWAHLDIAGTAMGSPQTEINRSWGSGFGVRLLNELVAEQYEK